MKKGFKKGTLSIIGQTRGNGIGYPFDGKSRGYGRLQGTAVMRKIQKERGGPH
jgi:hypothetical protein